MLNTKITVHRCRLLWWLLCFCITPPLVADVISPAGQLQPAIPGEMRSGVGLKGNGLLLSADGRWLCFSSSRGYGLMDLDSGEARGLGDIDYSWGLMIHELPLASWSPVEPLLAFPSFHEGDSFISVWSPVTGEKRDLLALPKDMRTSTATPVWSSDGKTLYVLLRKYLPWAKSHPDDDYPPHISENARLRMTQHYAADRVDRPRFEREYEGAHAESDRTLIMAIDVATGKAGLLAKGNDIGALYLSPDNKQLIAVQPKIATDRPSELRVQQVYVDMYLLATAAVSELPTVNLEETDRRAGWSDHKNRRLKPILTDVHLNEPDKQFFLSIRMLGTNGNPVLSWSPDSKRFAYATVGRQSKGDVFVYETATGKLRNLTKDIELPESPKAPGYGQHYTWVYNSLKFGGLHPPLWLPDSKSLVAVGRGDAWQMFVNSRKKPRRLTADVPQEVWRIVPAFDQRTALTDSKGRLTLIARHKKTRLGSLWKLNPANARAEKQADMNLWANRIVQAAASKDQLVYTGQTPQMAKNIYRVTDGEPAQRVTGYRLQLSERRYPTLRVLEWRTKAGEVARGLLYLPDGASKGNKAPMIVDGYPGRIESRLDNRMKLGPEFLNDALYGLLQEGFAVLYPDIEMSDEGVYEKPMQQIIEAVQSATEAALATNVIDQDRLGIMGSSYGGYMTQAVITQTDRFKAALSKAGLANLFANYVGGGSSGDSWSELGQGRLAVPLWQDPQRYVENSPLIHFDRVKTPLLLIHGEEDGRVPVEFSRESYRGLRNLENPTVFARYRRLGHGTTQEVDRRIRLWFKQHLLDGDKVAGLADQGSFFLGGELKQDKLTGKTETAAETKNEDKK